jgi:hypothetical protein
MTEQECNHIPGSGYGSGVARGRAELRAWATDTTLEGHVCEVTISRCTDCGQLVIFAQVNEDKFPVWKGWITFPTTLVEMKMDLRKKK